MKHFMVQVTAVLFHSMMFLEGGERHLDDVLNARLRS